MAAKAIAVSVPAMSWFTIQLTGSAKINGLSAEAKDEAGIFRFETRGSQISVEYSSSANGATNLGLDLETADAQVEFHVESERAGITFGSGANAHITQSQAEDFFVTVQ